MARGEILLLRKEKVRIRDFSYIRKKVFVIMVV